MDHPHQAVGLMAMAMAPLPGQFGEIGLTAEQGAGLGSCIRLHERRNDQAGRPWCGSKLLLQSGQRRLLRRAEADLLESAMACQGGVKATIGHILTERLVGKTQAEIGGMNRQAHAATTAFQRAYGGSQRSPATMTVMSNRKAP